MNRTEIGDGAATNIEAALLPAVHDFMPRDRRFAERCGRIRRADKVARLAGTLQGYIDAGQHSEICAEIAEEESRWSCERAQLVRSLERDLRERGYRTTHQLHEAGDAMEDAGEVTWRVGADHGEKTLQGTELAQKIGATSHHVWATIEAMAALRAKEDHDVEVHQEVIDKEQTEVVTVMRQQELELASKLATDKENLLQNMRCARANALETSRVRYVSQYAYEHSQRVERVKAVFSRLSQARSG